MAGERPISSLVVAELYEAGDDSFLDSILKARDVKPLLGIIEKWKKDRREWARRKKIEFIRKENWRGNGRVIFKRIIKQAWADRDDEVMGVCMYALDCSLRRERRKRYRWEGGGTIVEETLRLPPQGGSADFSTKTKHFLRRMAWRYFRRMGFQRSESYCDSIAKALARFTDDDVRAGENLLDCWGLMHACFGKSRQIQFSSRHTNLRIDGRMSELSAQPMFERLWANEESLVVLLHLLLQAQSRPVRVWAIQLLRRLHGDRLPKLDADWLLKLLDHTDADVAGFAAELLSDAQKVSAFPMSTWMGLLATRNPAVVASIVTAFRKHVSFDRVTLPQAVELAMRLASSVATVGMEILESRTIRSDADFRAIAGLSNARCEAVARRIAKFAISRLNVAGEYRVEEVIAFFDSRLKPMRDGAFSELTDESPAGTDPAFWARLFESPYDDVRLALVGRLKHRETLPGASADSLRGLWESVLLNIHRGGRAKLSALVQVSERLMREPASARVLIPVVAIAIRSVRASEARHGLAAIVSAVDRLPELESLVKQYLPELQILPSAESAGMGGR